MIADWLSFADYYFLLILVSLLMESVKILIADQNYAIILDILDEATVVQNIEVMKIVMY